MRAAIVLAIAALTWVPLCAVAQVVTPALEPALPAPSPTTGAAVVHANPAGARTLPASSSRASRGDQEGGPVTGATFAQGGRPPRGIGPLEEYAPGVYSLEGHTPGTLIRMRFGSTLTPACYDVPFDSTLHITAERVVASKVRTARPDAAIIPTGRSSASTTRTVRCC
jgi:hypothetical protein